MEELTTALNSHMDQMADLVEKFSAEMRSTLRPAYDNFIGFFHAIDWTVFIKLHPLFLASVNPNNLLNIRFFYF